MALKLPDSAVPMGDFPVAKAVDIDFDDGENLQDKFDNGELGGAGGASTASEVSYSNEALSSVSDVKMALDTIVGEKANTSDLTTHTGDANIHVTTTDKAKWDKVTDKLDTVDFNTHKNNTDIHITSVERTKWNEVDNKINKTDITTTIGSSSTDDKVPSAKAVKDITTYNTIDFVCPNNKSPLEFALENTTRNKIIYFRSWENDTYDNGVRFSSYIAITHHDPKYLTLIAISPIYRRYMINNYAVDKWTGWQELATMDKIEELSSNLDDLFQSVSDGKTLVANAITDKGVSTSTTATFATMATNVGKITNYTASEKQALATAITNKGVSTSSTATFATMATNISKISGGYKEETKTKSFSTTGISVLTITFSANVLAIKQIIAPSNSCSIVLQSSNDIFTINGKELIVHVTGGGTWSFTALIQN